jgi:hypothetical protein
MPGPHAGIGMLSVAAWWLRTAWVEEDDTEAAAAPATTTERAKMRTMVFMSGKPLINFGLIGNGVSALPKW